MRQPARTFQDLIGWQKAHRFVLSVYKFTELFPKSEIYGLTSQFRRAAISIAANIAEGFKKKGPADKVRFMNIAQSSLEECRYYLILSLDLGYGDTKELKKESEFRIQESELISGGFKHVTQFLTTKLKVLCGVSPFFIRQSYRILKLNSGS